MAEAKTYGGGCHCGKVRYEVTTDLGRVISCNCSICSRKGLLLVFVKPEEFTLRTGQEELTDYQFNKKRVHHLFCPACGVQSFATGALPDGRPAYAVNIRCLDDVDVSTLTLTPFDGKSL
jgi:hypothetical protein